VPDPQIVVLADLHLDVARWSTPGADGSPWSTAREAWEHICETAVQLRPEAVAMAGDTFHNGHPTPEAIQTIDDGVNRLLAAGIEVLFVDGNHEMAGWPRGYRNVLQIWQDLPGVHVALLPRWVTLRSGLALAALPWPPRSLIIEQAGHLPPEQLAEATAGWVADQAAALAETAPAGPSLLIGHAQLAGSIMPGSEQVVAPSSLWAGRGQWAVTPGQLAGPWSEVLLGHIHRPQTPASNMQYVGSPWTIDFTDAEDPHGCLVVSIDSWGSTQVRRQEGPDRHLVVLQVAQDAEIPEQDLAGTLVRLVMPGATPASQAVASRAVESMGGRVVNVMVPVAPRPHQLLRPISPEASPLQALQEWAAAQGLGDTERQAMLQAAQELLDEMDGSTRATSAQSVF
jgi:hypothetical protein